MYNYWYCTIAFKGIKKKYSYLCDSELEPGSCVIVPFGNENSQTVGIVISCAEYTENNVPYPVKQTKHIIREATIEEYKNQHYFKSYYEDDYSEEEYIENELEEADSYIKKKHLSEVYEWAFCNEDSPNEKIIKKVIECYELCAQNNMPDAAMILGDYYYNGEIVKQNINKAYEYYKIAADEGTLDALHKLGDYYCDNQNDNADYVQAYDYYSLGALLHNDPYCLYKLGDLYLNVYYIEKNEYYAFMLYMRALNSIDENEKNYLVLANIQHRIGRCYLYETGVNKNSKKAHELLSLSLINFYKTNIKEQSVYQMIQFTKKLLTDAQKQLETASDEHLL